MAMNLVKKAQIEAQTQAKVRAILFNEISTAILAEYFDYSDIFSAKNVAELSKHIKINDYTIKLIENK